MPVKLTADDYHQLAKEKGVKWLGQLPATVVNKTVWQCTKGHTWKASLHSLRKTKNGCPHCAGNAPKTEDCYHQVATDKGIKWLGPLPSSVRRKTKWLCHCGRLFWSTYASVVKCAGNCYECGIKVQAKKRRLKPKGYHALAKARGFHWLGPEVSTVLSPTAWECEKGHQWKTAYAHIQQGSGCPHCSQKYPKTPEDYHLLASKKGLIWLGPEVSSVSMTTRWRCSCGDTRLTSYASINKNSGKCPACAGNAPKVEDDFHQLASEEGLVWLGPMVPNTKTITEWMCSNGHKWETAYGNILSGSGCPKCKDMVNGQHVSQPQRDLHAMLEPFGTAVLNEPHGRLNIDIGLTVGDVRIAVEYDCWYWHKDRLKKDARRDRRLIRDGWRVLRVKSRTSLPTMEQLETAVNELVDGRTYTEIVLPDWGN